MDRMTENIEDVWKTYDMKRTDGTWPPAQVEAHLAKLKAEEEAKKNQGKDKKQQKKNK